ncbi:acyl-CoA/acyl-ACP dehydrogenase [Nocardia vinacea]|uniref:Acyl-CoA/acyl-ACP dehydrogenase n=1 Tax=Nocardia vinacea TaxID=96468 RepID=A0ABZ1YRE2_9NOCA|nr:acyl-CoA dehydrogenase family protein [Nocardia vinacea]
MRFELSEEQAELRAVVRSFLAEKSPETAVRAAMAAEREYDPALWRQLCGQLGLAALAVPEEYGGAGFGFVELGVAVEEMGRALAVTPFLASVVMSSTLLLACDDEAAKKAYLPGLAAGEMIGTVALAEDSGRWTVDAVTMRAEQRGADWILHGHKSFVLDLLAADVIFVVARTDTGPAVFALDATGDGVERTALPVLDQTRRQGRLRCRDAVAVLVGSAEDGWPAVQRMLDLTAVALSAEMLGGAQRTLEMSVDYAKIRIQFGRVIGSFQAIKHKCASVLMEIEAARSAVYYALWSAATDAADLPAVASLTKAFCSETYQLAAQENLQIHGGIGYTWEHPAHLYLKRAKHCALFLGGGDFHRERLAQLTGIAG